MVVASNAGNSGQFQVIKNATAQADTGQTLNVFTPPWAVEAIFYLNWTANGGTSPLIDFAIKEVDPVNQDTAIAIEGWDGITQLSASALITVRIGPGYASTTPDDTGVNYHIGTTLPPVLQTVTTLDRTSGNETYTYTLSVYFR